MALHVYSDYLTKEYGQISSYLNEKQKSFMNFFNVQNVNFEKRQKKIRKSVTTHSIYTIQGRQKWGQYNVIG